MALNPEISLGVRPPQIAPLQLQTPLDRYQKMLTLRHLMTQGQLGQMNLEQTRLENERLQRTAQDEQNLGSWMQQNQRPDLTGQEIAAANPNRAGIEFAAKWSAQQTGALTQYKTKLEVALEEAKTDDRIYNSVTPGDKQSKLAALAQLVQLKRISGDQAAQIAGLPDEDFAKLQQQAALASQDRLQRIQAEKEAIALRIAKVTEPFVTRKAEAEATSAEQDTTGTQPITPYQQAQLDKPSADQAAFETNFLPGFAQSRGWTGKLTPQQTYVAFSEFQKTKQPYMPIAGRDFPKPQSVEDQEARARAAAAAAAAAAEPATEAENRSLGFYDRSAEADKTLESVKDHIKNKSTAGLWLIQNAPNATLSKEDQAYMQGARQFINAYLRRDSGAAIQPSEWDEAYRTFLPYAGDKPETLALKARERKVIIEGLKTSAGRAYGRKYGETGATPTKKGGKHEKGSDPGGIR